jgi:hypothetical protein
MRSTADPDRARPCRSCRRRWHGPAARGWFGGRCDPGAAGRVGEKVVSAFQNVPAHLLQDLNHEVGAMSGLWRRRAGA